MSNSPAPFEIEMTVFGPGYGESVALHAGNGDWFVIDSCLQKGEKEPAATQYLRSIGVDLSKQVRGIIITHWDADHIKGMPTQVRECSSAEVWISQAVRTPHCLAMLEEDTGCGTPRSVGLEVFAEVWHLLVNDEQGKRLRFAGQGVTIFEDVLKHGELDFRRRLLALSPPGLTVARAITNLASQANTLSSRRSAPDLGCNEEGVCVYFDVGPRSVLLSNDLMWNNNKYSGWQSVLDHSMPARIPVDMYKVAHHGSSKSDNKRIWEELISAQATAVLTPFWRGKSKLPTASDVRRLKASAGSLYSTNPRPKTEFARREHVKEKWLKDKRLIPNPPRKVVKSKGHVTIRQDILSGNISRITVGAAGAL